jgi:O-antigen/teichoic acid export membrane protein
MLGARLIGTAVMYIGMRRHAPWLTFGKPTGSRRELRRLLGPALASGAFPLGFALNIQGMVLLVGIGAGPASAAIFSTLRTLSRSIIQLLSSISAVVAPEISKAYGEGNSELLRLIHRRAVQAALWTASAIVLVIALGGDRIMHAWTGGRVGTGGALLYLFLAMSAIDCLWYTSIQVLYATNRHQRVALDYVIACIVTVPLGYGLLRAWGLDGPAIALLGLELFMVAAVLPRALRAAHDTFRGLLAYAGHPPLYVFGGLAGMRASMRGSA